MNVVYANIKKNNFFYIRSATDPIYTIYFIQDKKNDQITIISLIDFTQSTISRLNMVNQGNYQVKQAKIRGNTGASHAEQKNLFLKLLLAREQHRMSL